MPLPDGIKVRQARRGDRDSIYRLLGELGIAIAVSEQSSALSWIVSHPEIEVLLAVDPLDRGVGLVALAHRPTLEVGGRAAYIDSLVVTEPMRRRGIGSELLERALARARMLGCKQVELCASLGTARDYLGRRGFKSTGLERMVWTNSGTR